MSLPFDQAPDCNGDNCTNVLTSRTEFKRGYCCACDDGSLEILKQIKAAVQNAMKNDVAENYKYLVVEGELVRIYFLVDKLLKEQK